MNAVVRKLVREDQSSVVVPFPSPHRPAGTHSVADPMHGYVGLESFERTVSRLNELIAFHLTESSIRRYTGNGSPFDAVYISLLTPDPIDQGDIRRIMAFRHILDRSDEINFADGLD